MNSIEHRKPTVKAPAQRRASTLVLGLTITFAVELCFLLASSTAFAGKIKYTYDGAGRLTAAQIGNSGLTTFLYDANGNLLNRTTAPATNADVRLTKTSDFTGRTVGNNITYLLTVTNAGPTAATGVTVTDPLPFGVLFSSASASQGTVSFTNHVVTADLGVISAGGSATLNIVIFHGLTNTATNIAMVTATTPDPNPANNTASRVTSGLGPINDSDGDGMPNWWETLNGISPFSSANPNGPQHDRDGDGITNFDEWIADTRANDAVSRFEIASQVFESGAGEFSLTIHSSPIRQYDLEFTEEVSQPFVTVETVNGTGGPITFSHTSGTARGYYRVQVRVPKL